jgi:hypothetical protein
MAIEVAAAERTRPAEHERPAGDLLDSIWLAILLLAAAGIEGLLLIMLRRLSIEKYPAIVQTPQPVADAIGVTERGLTWFVLLLAGMALLYAVGYFAALRLRDARAGWIAIACSVVFIATALPVFPGGAQDVYHNVVDARTLWVYHQNPISTPPDAHPEDPIASQLFSWQDITSSYGPVWYAVSGAPLPFTGTHLVRNVVGQKILVSIFLLATLLLIYETLRRRWPERATAAVVLLGWSPLALWEIGVNAHNDIVMMCFAVAALCAVLLGRWRWAFPLLALAVGAKFTMLAIAPLLFVWLWRRVPVERRRELWLSIGVGVALLALVYLPFLLLSPNLANTSALRDRFISSPASLFIAFAMQNVSLSQAENLARALATLAFFGGYAVVLWRCWRGSLGLLAAAFWTAFLILTLPTWWFWPWYAIWMLPIAALLAGRREATLGLLFGVTALMVYPIYYWRDVILNGPNWYANQFVIVGAVFGPPAIYLLTVYVVPHLVPLPSASGGDEALS